MIIAVDGYSSCGKSTLSKRLASELDFIYIDTGAMYRAVTLYFLDHEIDIANDQAVLSGLEKINITFENIAGANTCFLNDNNVEQEIRGMRVSSFVSEVAAVAAVREASVKMQRSMSVGKSVVMDGRDIGTVVFPQAEVKLFVTADTEVRAQRRYKEMLAKGKQVTIEDVKQNLNHRDSIDTTRAHSPLRQSADAYVIDNTLLTKEEQLKVALAYIHKVKAQL